MCEFCTSHGEGKKWYENAANYSREIFLKGNTDESIRKYLMGFRKSLATGPALAHKWKRRLPRIYKAIAYPLITRNLKKTHFGQVVPIEDIEGILKKIGNIIRLPCVCRKVTIGKERRYCFGIGIDMTHIYADVPDFSDFEKVSADEAIAQMRELDTEGNIHSVWTFNTPFIGAICNCDRDCMAYRVEKTLGVSKTMWKAEYVAKSDMLSCTGCRKCMKHCHFGAIKYDRQNNKCTVNADKCYGCGVCRAVCDEGALTLLPRGADLGW